VLPIHGVIGQKFGMEQFIFGGCSTDVLGQQLQQALASRQVDAVVLDIDSPGGTVAGVQELADQIHAARDQKPIISVANSVACSAAYWLGSQASSFTCTPGGEVGSIGVFAVHEDHSRRLADSGVKVTIIKSSGSPYKAEGNPYEPLDSSAEAHLQQQVDESYAKFVNAVARGRSARRATVMSDAWGQGRSLMASRAKAAGMVDSIATLTETLSDLQLANGRLARRGLVGVNPAMKAARILHELQKLETTRMQMQA
jgi:signal peptide peptidase SppA